MNPLLNLYYAQQASALMTAALQPNAMLPLMGNPFLGNSGLTGLASAQALSELIAAAGKIPNSNPDGPSDPNPSEDKPDKDSDSSKGSYEARFAKKMAALISKDTGREVKAMKDLDKGAQDAAKGQQSDGVMSHNHDGNQATKGSCAGQGIQRTDDPEADAEKAFQQWKASPPHYAIMKQATKIGAGISESGGFTSLLVC